MPKLKTIVVAGFCALGLASAGIVIAGALEKSVDPGFEDSLAQTPSTGIETLVASEAERLDVTALSVTMLDGDSAPQTFYFGRAREGGLMQVASLSKAVAAAVILTVAEQQGVGIDDDLRSQITSLDLTSLEGGDRPVTLRQLLSHTTGASQSGYPGYPRETDPPTTAEVINAPPRIFESRLEFDGEPGTFRYSGGGYTIAQLWAEDVSGKGFAELADDVLLGPLGMTESTFAQPIDEAAITPLTIVGADSGFDPMGGVFSSFENSWHDYPEKAAAGLWASSQDYARFVAALLDAAHGSESGVSPSVASAMIAPEADTSWGTGFYYGLGVALKTDEAGAITEVWHSGANAGYRSYFAARPATQDAPRRVVVSVANTASAASLNEAIVGALVAR